MTIPKNWRNKVLTYTLVALIIAFLVLALRAGNVFLSIARYRGYWLQQNTQPVPDNAFIYVALGDSTAQGIGATSPRKGYVGQLAKRIEARISRPVHVINFSISGAKLTDLEQKLLPEFDKLSLKPDLVTLGIGSNDMPAFDQKKFEAGMQSILKRLPEDTIVLEISPYFKEKAATSNKIINRLASQEGIRAGPLDKVIRDKLTWRTYGGDFFHPSNYGYKLWTDAFWEVVEPTLHTNSET